MKPPTKAPIREVADFLVHRIHQSTQPTHLSILRDMMDRTLLQRYSGDPELGQQYSRVDRELNIKEAQLSCNYSQANIMDFCIT